MAGFLALLRSKVFKKDLIAGINQMWLCCPNTGTRTTGHVLLILEGS